MSTSSTCICLYGLGMRAEAEGQGKDFGGAGIYAQQDIPAR